MTERAFWLAWRQMPRVGPTLIMRLQREFGSLEAAWQASGQALGAVQGFGPKTLTEVMAARPQCDPLVLYREHLVTNPLFWTPGESDYPALLRELPAPPVLLYYRGAVDLAENRGLKAAIAIVGTRRPTDYGLRWTQRLSRALTQRGFTVVSGLAEGIDTAAHRACLEAGGRTIAVVGTGVDRVYPAANRRLCEAILGQGLVVSEYPAGTRPDRSHFPQRNRIIAGLCRAVIVVEAPKRSGALITAYAANEFGRDVYVVPGSLDQAQARGGLELIHQGAQVILDEVQLLQALGSLPPLDGDGGEAHPETTPETTPASAPEITPGMAATLAALDPALQAIWQQVPSEACSLDGLLLRCNQNLSNQELGDQDVNSQNSGSQNLGELSSALLQLELLGLVVELPGKYYQRSGLAAHFETTTGN